MTTKEAVRIVLSHPSVKEEPVIHATGHICRAAQAVRDRPENFYMIGSMGLASSIALGVALSKPRQRVIALDGDGAVLMNMGTLATVGALKPANFYHLVIDNASYESTGGQPSLTQTVRLETVARSCGYRYAKRVSAASRLKRELKSLALKKGPAFLLIRTSPDAVPPPPRIRTAPEEITKNFKASLR